MKLWLASAGLRIALAVIAVLPGAIAARTVAAAGGKIEPEIRLVMVEAPGCRFCAQWHADIGAAYANSREGAFAPLERVERDADLLRGLKPVIYTPTFIVVHGSVETGRISGYPGKDYFWSELHELLVPLGFRVDTRTGFEKPGPKTGSENRVRQIGLVKSGP